MRGYIFAIQRFFNSEWGYKLNFTSGTVFGCPKTGLFCVLDNLFADQQARGLTPQSHNVLSAEDVEKLFKSEHLSDITPKSLQTRIIFSVFLAAAIRPSEIHQLKFSQLTFGTQGNIKVVRIKNLIGSTTGLSLIHI